MAGLQICYTVDGDTTCFPIPMLVGPQWPPPLEIPGWLFEGPRPNPWTGGISLSPEVVRDLRVLSTIDALAETLTPAIRTALRAELRRALDTVSLPAGTAVRG